MKTIEIAGAAHTPRAALDAVTRRYVGLNLFKIDIARVQRDSALPWVSRIEIEKKLPDTLRINVVERTPVALRAQRRARCGTSTSTASTFAELSPRSATPICRSSRDAMPAAELRAHALQLRRATLRARDPQLYSRISEVRPIAPRRLRAVRPRARRGRLRQRRATSRRSGASLYAIVAGRAARPRRHRIRGPPFRRPHRRQTGSPDHDRRHRRSRRCRPRQITN